jgi:hypothetical protein
MCPGETPYSRVGSVGDSNCSACGSGCEDGGWGMYSCVDTRWVAWVDVEGVEGVNSCIRILEGAGSWSDSAEACRNTSAQLLTSAQVRVR